jgi:hypothetical protein
MSNQFGKDKLRDRVTHEAGALGTGEAPPRQESRPSVISEKAGRSAVASQVSLDKKKGFTYYELWPDSGLNIAPTSETSSI